MDALKTVLVVVGGLAAHPDEHAVDLPLVVEGDDAGQLSDAVLLADLLPQHGVNLLVGRGGGHDDGLTGGAGVDPPGGDHASRP